MKEKNGKAPRPKFHVYFETPSIMQADRYKAIKTDIQKAYPFFDDNALDAGRFIYGSKSEDVIWHPGKKTILDLITDQAKTTGLVIPVGKRNSTLSRFAGRVVKRYGHTDAAHKIFLDEAKKCDPPLSEDELSKIWASAGKWEKKVSSAPGYVPPDKFGSGLPSGPAGSLKPDDYSDVGQAKVIANEYGDELCFTEQTGFLRYNGINWEISDVSAMGAIEEFLDLQLADADLLCFEKKQALVNMGITEEEIASPKKAAKGLDGDALSAFMEYLAACQYHAFVMQRRNIRYINAAKTAVQPFIKMSYDEIDNEPFLLNTPSATYDLRQGMKGKQDHKAGNHITKVTAVDPSDKGSDLWKDMLEKTFLGDQEVIDYVQEVIGLAAIGHVYVEAIIIAYGEGHNGKSTFFNSVARVMGDYSGSISADTLTVGVRRNTKWEVTELKGKRLAIAAELEEGQRLSTSVLKQVTSTDKIQGERKFQTPGDFTPTHTIILYTNHLPKVGASDAGTWRRLIVIPFKANFTGKGDIKNYADFLFENAGPAILAWVIEGAYRAIQDDFHIARPAVVEEAIKAYQEDNDWMSAFLENCCDVDESYQEKSGELYLQYRNYCDRIGEFARSTADFYTEIKNRGFERKKKREGIIVKGLRLKTGEDFL